MDIPIVIRWIFLGLFVFGLFMLMLSVNRFRRGGLSGRPDAAWEIADQGASLLFAAAMVAGSWTLAVYSLLLAGPVMIAKHARSYLRHRRAPAA
ncbi:hypothetical protein [Streptomyces sp. G-G2]|uniref:hypothetical protein n=1 Tax=Streptomyces sp. G-G2 TaxID=3046201 RepID=UPI0024BAF6EB|nr:hypothetical protein [Streptomyces sp. G-G2]MDJ0383342.1 hypothetical protein [Streptomyces sp. G-G2]